MFPVKSAVLEGALIDRELSSTDTYTKSNLRAMDLAVADCCMTLITSPTVLEGGYQLNHSNKGELRRLAEAIYSKWGESNPYNSPKVRDATNRW